MSLVESQLLPLLKTPFHTKSAVKKRQLLRCTNSRKMPPLPCFVSFTRFSSIRSTVGTLMVTAHPNRLTSPSSSTSISLPPTSLFFDDPTDTRYRGLLDIDSSFDVDFFSIVSRSASPPRSITFVHLKGPTNAQHISHISSTIIR
jgi:hypothetical protein